MNLEVITFVNGRWRQNCYLVSNGRGDAIIIDPGSQDAQILAIAQENGWHVHGIINTHAHFDHVGAVAPLRVALAAPFYLHSADSQLLKRANLYRMMFESREPIKVPEIDCDIAGLPAAFPVGPFEFQWLGTPGHTDGSVCLRLGTYLFSGDTLMQGCIGRTDLPGANRDMLLRSVRKLADLPPDTIVCGGHGRRTTIEAEFSPGSSVDKLLQ